MEEVALSGVCVLVMLAGVLAGAWWLLHRPGCGQGLHDCEAIADAEQAVLDVLPDPGSARFRNLRFYSAAQVTYGEVNARNGAGVYTGFCTFTVRRGGEVLLDAASGAESHSRYPLVPG